MVLYCICLYYILYSCCPSTNQLATFLPTRTMTIFRCVCWMKVSRTFERPTAFYSASILNLSLYSLSLSRQGKHDNDRRQKQAWARRKQCLSCYRMLLSSVQLVGKWPLACRLGVTLHTQPRARAHTHTHTHTHTSALLCTDNTHFEICAHRNKVGFCLQLNCSLNNFKAPTWTKTYYWYIVSFLILAIKNKVKQPKRHRELYLD